MTEKTVCISSDEVIQVFNLMTKINHFFHQPMHYENPEDVEKFAAENYREIHSVYYDVVWNWLPEEEKRRIIDT